MWKVYLFEFIIVVVISIVWATIIDRALKKKEEDDRNDNKD